MKLQPQFQHGREYVDANMTYLSIWAECGNSVLRVSDQLEARLFGGHASQIFEDNCRNCAATSMQTTQFMQDLPQVLRVTVPMMPGASGQGPMRVQRSIVFPLEIHPKQRHQDFNFFYKAKVAICCTRREGGHFYSFVRNGDQWWQCDKRNDMVPASFLLNPDFCSLVETVIYEKIPLPMIKTDATAVNDTLPSAVNTFPTTVPSASADRILVDCTIIAAEKGNNVVNTSSSPINDLNAGLGAVSKPDTLKTVNKPPLPLLKTKTAPLSVSTPLTSPVSTQTSRRHISSSATQLTSSSWSLYIADFFEYSDSPGDEVFLSDLARHIQTNTPAASPFAVELSAVCNQISSMLRSDNKVTVFRESKKAKVKFRGIKSYNISHLA